MFDPAPNSLPVVIDQPGHYRRRDGGLAVVREVRPPHDDPTVTAFAAVGASYALFRGKERARGLSCWHVSGRANPLNESPADLVERVAGPPLPLPVIFRTARRGEFKGWVTAFFPTLPWDRHGREITCYQHVGQHGGASWSFYQSSDLRPSTPEELAPLLAELQGIYDRSMDADDTAYTLHPCRKMTRQHMAAFNAAARSNA